MTHLARSNVTGQVLMQTLQTMSSCCTIFAKHKALHTVQPMLPYNIPDGPWQ